MISRLYLHMLVKKMYQGLDQKHIKLIQGTIEHFLNFGKGVSTHISEAFRIPIPALYISKMKGQHNKIYTENFKKKQNQTQYNNSRVFNRNHKLQELMEWCKLTPELKQKKSTNKRLSLAMLSYRIKDKHRTSKLDYKNSLLLN